MNYCDYISYNADYFFACGLLELRKNVFLVINTSLRLMNLFMDAKEKVHAHI